MCYSAICLGYYLLTILFGFSILIFFCLKFRNSVLQENLKITADQLWTKVSDRAVRLNLPKSNILFGVPQDASTTSAYLLVKNASNEIVGRVFYQLASRERTITIDDKKFLVKFPLTWHRTAVLYASNGGDILAKYKESKWLGQHEYDIHGYGTLKSERPVFSYKKIFNYRLGKDVVGTRQEISTTFNRGRLVLLPLDLPIEVRIFILSF